MSLYGGTFTKSAGDQIIISPQMYNKQHKLSAKCKHKKKKKYN